MPKRALESLTESMFYVLMAFCAQPMCGTEVTEYIRRISNGRMRIGPATLYTILGKFEKEKYIQETQVDGRKRTYQVTDLGRDAYETELNRLRQCVLDAQRERRDQNV